MASLCVMTPTTSSKPSLTAALSGVSPSLSSTDMSIDDFLRSFMIFLTARTSPCRMAACSASMRSAGVSPDLCRWPKRRKPDTDLVFCGGARVPWLAALDALAPRTAAAPTADARMDDADPMSPARSPVPPPARPPMSANGLDSRRRSTRLVRADRSGMSAMRLVASASVCRRTQLLSSAGMRTIWLSLSHSFSSWRHRPISGGTDSSRLRFIERRSRRTRPATCAGISVIWFWSSQTRSREETVSSSDGQRSSVLFSTQISLRLYSWAICGGKPPTARMRLLDSLSFSRLTSMPISGGSEVSWFA
mmetsp:Transcript_5671/g.18424  ORF Transcript_5671/g.18424 Transcript_5671/m.18424 type:complete len:306 (+) Transcript_5671:1642-2559(+)